jgi:hypothetical protein
LEVGWLILRVWPNQGSRAMLPSYFGHLEI